MSFEAVTHDKHETDKYQKNLHILKLITKAALLCSGQGIAFQFHRKQSNYKEGYHEIWVNRENFIAIINAFAKLDPILQDHLKNGQKKCKNDIMENPEWYNSFSSGVLKEENNGGYTEHYVIIADQVTDQFSNE